MSSFRVEAFRYFGETQDSIYMQCAIRMCLLNDMSAECQYCDNNGRRQRRDTSDEEIRAPAINDNKIVYVKSPVFLIIPSGELIYNQIQKDYPVNARRYLDVD